MQALGDLDVLGEIFVEMFPKLHDTPSLYLPIFLCGIWLFVNVHEGFPFFIEASRGFGRSKNVLSRQKALY